MIISYPDQPGVELTYYTSGGSGDGGDQYTGLDRFGRIIDQRWRRIATDADVERMKYGYSRASNRRWRQNTVAGSGQDEFYTYDGLYQVKNLDRGTLNAGKTGITGTPGWAEAWNYDPVGNWHGTSTAYQTQVNGATTLNQNRSHNVANEITDVTETTGTSWPTPAHDAAGNMTSIPRPLSLGSSFDLKWDAWNRLVEVKNTGGSVVAGYQYDGAFRRVTKSTGGTTRHYYYSDQWQILEERVDNATSAARRYVWGIRSIDDLVLRDRGSERLYVLADAMIVRVIVDATGAVLERYGYDGFGAALYMDASFTSRSASNYEWETLFDAYRYDLETGLYQVRHRYLHPNLGRWPNRDPIGENGGINLYGFVRNRPVNAIDADGLVEFPRLPTIPSFPWPNPLPRPNPPPRSWPSWPSIKLPEDPISCGNRIKNEVWEKFAPGGQLPPGDPSFHYGHCVAHCRIQRECLGGRFTSWAGGLGKEIWDEIQQHWHKKGAGWEGGDMDANREGRKRGRHCKEKSCEEACKGM